MWHRLRQAPASRAIIVAALTLSAAGCALMRDDFAPSASTGTLATSLPGGAPLDVKPAVLVEQGAPVTTATPGASAATANLDDLPPLPGPDAGQEPAKLLSPDEKARVIAEFEALARGEPAPVAKQDCTQTAAAGKAATASASAACASAPKPALRP